MEDRKESYKEFAEHSRSIICAHCHREIPKKSAFCPYCGGEIGPDGSNKRKEEGKQSNGEGHFVKKQNGKKLFFAIITVAILLCLLGIGIAFFSHNDDNRSTSKDDSRSTTETDPLDDFEKTTLDEFKKSDRNYQNASCYVYDVKNQKETGYQDSEQINARAIGRLFVFEYISEYLKKGEINGEQELLELVKAAATTDLDASTELMRALADKQGISLKEAIGKIDNYVQDKYGQTRIYRFNNVGYSKDVEKKRNVTSARDVGMCLKYFWMEKEAGNTFAAGVLDAMASNGCAQNGMASWISDDTATVSDFYVVHSSCVNDAALITDGTNVVIFSMMTDGFDGDDNDADKTDVTEANKAQQEEAAGDIQKVAEGLWNAYKDEPTEETDLTSDTVPEKKDSICVYQVMTGQYDDDETRTDWLRVYDAFDEYGNYTSVSYYAYDIKIETDYQLDYDSQGNLVMRIALNSQLYQYQLGDTQSEGWNLVSDDDEMRDYLETTKEDCDRIVYEYDEEGQLLKETAYSDAVDDWEFMMEYEYDSEGRVTKKTECSLEQDNQIVTQYHYDSGKIDAEKKEIYNSGGEDELPVEVTYDEEFNTWCEKTYIDEVSDAEYTEETFQYCSFDDYQSNGGKVNENMEVEISDLVGGIEGQVEADYYEEGTDFTTEDYYDYLLDVLEEKGILESGYAVMVDYDTSEELRVSIGEDTSEKFTALGHYSIDKETLTITDTISGEVIQG